MLFQYGYIDAKGRRKYATIDAEGLQSAKEKLRAQKLLVVSLVEKKGEDSSSKLLKNSKKRRSSVSKGSLIVFTVQLSELLIAGIPLYEGLISLEEEYQGENLHPYILYLAEQIRKGSSFSEALGHFPELFDSLYCSMVAAGERVGELSISLKKLGTLMAKQQKIRKQLTTALLYPLVLCSFSLFVCVILFVFVIPSLEVLFEERDVNRFTSGVMYMSRFLRKEWPYYLPGLGLLALAFRSFFRSKKGKQKLHHISLHIPFVKTLLIQGAMTRFSRTMGTLLQGGVSIIQALQIGRKVLHNPILHEVIVEAEKKITEGSSLSYELKKSSYIPRLVSRMLAIGEEGGNGAEMLHKIADYYEEEMEKSLLRLTTLAQPLVLVIMGGIIGLIMLAVLLPLTDVNAFL